MKKTSPFEGLSAEEISKKVQADILALARYWQQEKHPRARIEDAATRICALYLHEHPDLYVSHKEEVPGTKQRWEQWMSLMRAWFHEALSASELHKKG